MLSRVHPQHVLPARLSGGGCASSVNTGVRGGARHGPLPQHRPLYAAADCTTAWPRTGTRQAPRLHRPTDPAAGPAAARALPVQGHLRCGQRCSNLSHLKVFSEATRHLKGCSQPAQPKNTPQRYAFMKRIRNRKVRPQCSLTTPLPQSHTLRLRLTRAVSGAPHCPRHHCSER